MSYFVYLSYYRFDSTGMYLITKYGKKNLNVYFLLVDKEVFLPDPVYTAPVYSSHFCADLWLHRSLDNKGKPQN